MTAPEFTTYLNNINYTFENYSSFIDAFDMIRKDTIQASFHKLKDNNDDSYTIRIMTGDYFMWDVTIYK